MLIFGVIFLVVMWPLSLLGHAIGLTPNFNQLMHRHARWEHQHYPLVGLRYVGTLLAALLVLILAVVLSSRSLHQPKAAPTTVAAGATLASVEGVTAPVTSQPQAGGLSRPSWNFAAAVL